MGQAFSKPAIEWETVPAHKRGHWFLVNRKYIKPEELRAEDLLSADCSASGERTGAWR
jgi:hypothetical protein